LVSLCACVACKSMGEGVAGGNVPLRWVAQDALRLEPGRRPPLPKAYAETTLELVSQLAGVACFTLFFTSAVVYK
jgi:hypothetical protein